MDPEIIGKIVNWKNDNITAKSDVGNYLYDTRPHAVTTIENPTTNISTIKQNIAYNAFNKVDSIKSPSGEKEAVFTYGTDQDRKKMIVTNNGAIIKTIIYQNNYEKIKVGDNSYEVNYIYSSDGLIAINIKHNSEQNKLYYVHTDHLGSIISLHCRPNVWK